MYYLIVFIFANFHSFRNIFLKTRKSGLHQAERDRGIHTLSLTRPLEEFR